MTSVHSKFLDTSSELLIYRHGSGIKLVRPEDQDKQKESPYSHYTGYTVGNCLGLNCGIYFGNRESKIQKINDLDADLIGCLSAKEAVGKDAYSFITEEIAAGTIRQDIEAMSKNKTIIVEDTYAWEDKPSQDIVVIKSPWYDNENRVVGVFGFGSAIDKNFITGFLNSVSQMGLLAPAKFSSKDNGVLSGSTIDGVYLSQRETEVLKQAALGKSARVAGAILGISQRTVESHLENIKMKLNVYSKSELIDKAVHAFYSK